MGERESLIAGYKRSTIPAKTIGTVVCNIQFYDHNINIKPFFNVSEIPVRL